METSQSEITSAGPLLLSDGNLARRGFARRSVIQYNPEKISIGPSGVFTKFRKKEWDYYGITSRDWFFSSTVADVGYMGMVFVYFIDFSSGKVVERTTVTPFGRGCNLPHSSGSGDVNFSDRNVGVSFTIQEGRRILSIFWKNFSPDGDLSADLVLHQADDTDSIVMATPMAGRNFYFNHKINCMPAEGSIKIGGRLLCPKIDDTLGTLDWGRGVWDYSSFWNWASASGFMQDGGTIGLNLGKGFGDLSSATENCVFLNGRMDKLGWVDFVYDPGNFMIPWKLISDDGRLDLAFTPFLDRSAKVNLVVLKSEVHQMFGKYTGRFTTETGKVIGIKNLTGWAEEHRARW